MTKLPDELLPPPMTDEEIAAAVADDPDAAPIMSPEEIAAMFERSRKADPYGLLRLRHRLGLTQKGFAKRYGIPLNTLRQWEQQVAEPDQSAKVLLAVIAEDADLVARVASRLAA
jgi:putative transcriptional regulator